MMIHMNLNCNDVQGVPDHRDDEYQEKGYL